MVMNATGAALVCLGPSSGFEVRPVLRRSRRPARSRSPSLRHRSIQSMCGVRKAMVGDCCRLLGQVGFPWYSAMILPAR